MCETPTPVSSPSGPELRIPNNVWFMCKGLSSCLELFRSLLFQTARIYLHICFCRAQALGLAHAQQVLSLPLHGRRVGALAEAQLYIAFGLWLTSLNHLDKNTKIIINILSFSKFFHFSFFFPRSVIFRETQIKAAVKYHLRPVKIVYSQNGPK